MTKLEKINYLIQIKDSRINLYKAWLKQVRYNINRKRQLNRRLDKVIGQKNKLLMIKSKIS